MEYGNVEVGKVGLIQQMEDGTITQIGLTKEQSEMLQALVGMLSDEKKPLLRLPKQFNLEIVNG